MYEQTDGGADAGSDHYLVVAKLQLKLNKENARSTTVKYDRKKLDEMIHQQHLQLTLRNKFQALRDLNDEDEGIK